MKEALTIVVSLITALGGWEAIKYLLNRKTNSRIAEANAFKVEREALIEDYKRVQGEVDKLKEQVAKLYTEIDTLKNDRLRLIQENNELKLELKEAEKHVCLQPDAIITEEDMMKPKKEKENEKDKQSDNPL